MTQSTYPTKTISECIQKLPRKSGIPLKQYQKIGKFPVIDQGQDFIGGYTDDESLVYSKDFSVVIFGDHTRAVKFVDFPFAVGADGTKVLKPKDFLDPKFFYFSLMSLDIESRGYARHFRILKELEIPIPPIAEQKKIVARLEGLLGMTKEAKRLRAESETAAQNLLPAELHRIFTQHTTPHKQHTNKLENVGMSGKWEEKELGEVVNIEAKKNTKSLPYVGMEDIESGTGKFIGSKEKRAVRSTTSHFTADHVLYGKLRPYLNKFLVPDFEGHCTTEFLPLRPDTRFLTREWLAVWLRHNETVDNIMATTTGSRMPRANMNLVKKFKIPLPPLAEQRKIVARLDFLSEKIRRLQEYQKSTASDFISLEQSILSKSFQ